MYRRSGRRQWAGRIQESGQGERHQDPGLPRGLAEAGAGVPGTVAEAGAVAAVVVTAGAVVATTERTAARFDRSEVRVSDIMHSTVGLAHMIGNKPWEQNPRSPGTECKVL